MQYNGRQNKRRLYHDVEPPPAIPASDSLAFFARFRWLQLTSSSCLARSPENDLMVKRPPAEGIIADDRLDESA